MPEGEGWAAELLPCVGIAQHRSRFTPENLPRSGRKLQQAEGARGEYFDRLERSMPTLTDDHVCVIFEREQPGQGPLPFVEQRVQGITEAGRGDSVRQRVFNQLMRARDGQALEHDVPGQGEHGRARA